MAKGSGRKDSGSTATGRSTGGLRHIARPIQDVAYKISNAPHRSLFDLACNCKFDGENLRYFTLDKDLVCYGMMKEVEDGFVLEWTKNSRPERGRISNKKGPHMEIIKDETARKYFTNLVKRVLAKSKTAELFPSRIQYELEIQYDKKYL